MIVTCGIFGLAYSGLAWRETVRDGLSARIDLEDRIWYAILPAVGYLCETGSGIALAMRLDLGCMALASAVGILLLAAIHNAWDITIWSVTRNRADGDQAE